MSIDPVGLSQLYSTQQAQALSAVSADIPMDPPSGEPPAAGSNALTGTATPNLDSQTLQALLDLTQQDSGDTPQTNKTGQPGQTGQVQHRHHHHRGGQTLPSDPSQTASTAADGGSPATASGIESDTAEASLTSALLNA